MIGPFPDDDAVRRAYAHQYQKLARVAKALEREIRRQVANNTDVVLVQSRPKEIESFVTKAMRSKQSNPDGTPSSARTPKPSAKAQPDRKYTYPLEEIQDQVGCRVVVKSPKARRAVALLLAAHFGHLEKGYKADKDPRVFGYAAHHVVCPIPEPLRHKENPATQSFEIQVATLFQFAWSQMEHAVGYKSGKKLTIEQRRNLAAAAALAETADVLFSRVRETE